MCKNAIPIDKLTVHNGTLFYPDYLLAWDEGKYIKTLPIPPGCPTHATWLTCCAIAYAGQYSQACINSASITNFAINSSLFYPDYSLMWDVGKCVNMLPIPSGQPTYSTQLSCCKAAYADQQSNACIQAIPLPPTSSPTKIGGPGIYYPNSLTLFLSPLEGLPTRTNWRAVLEPMLVSQAGFAFLRPIPNS